MAFFDLFFGPLSITIIIGFFTLMLVYWYAVRTNSYWTSRGVQQPNSLPFVGSALDFIRKPLHEVEVQRYKELGLIYGHYEGSKPCLSVSDLNVLRNILVKDFHLFIDRRVFVSNEPVIDAMLPHLQTSEWKRVRNIVSPTFTTGKIKRMLGIFKECANTLKGNFKKASELKEPVDTKKMYGAFVIDVIANAAFSTKIDSHNDPENDFAVHAGKMFNPGKNPFFFVKILLFLAFPWVIKLLKLPIFPKDSTEFFKRVVRQIIAERRKIGQSRNDFLQLLMDTAKEEKISEQPEEDDLVSNYGPDDVAQLIIKNVTSKHLSEDEMIAQCVIFFLAGYETAASALAFTTYYLAIHPEIQEKLREEIQQTTENSNGEVTYEAIQSMKYLDNIISETLRLHPPLIRLDRTVSEDYHLTDYDIVIPKGMLVSIPICAIHRDPKYFPDPERFDPDRFNPDEKLKRDAFCYLPFGAGPRNCVGMRFALMEMKTCLAEVVKSFTIHTHPETKIPLEFHNGGGLLAPKPILLSFKPIE